MELTKDKWEQDDIEKFLKYLNTFSKGEEKGKWEQRIVNTSLPCIAVPCTAIKQITNQIAKGNFLEFIDLWIWDNFSAVSIIGNLICKIKDFDTLSKYLDIYSSKVDNWAHCDLLKFKDIKLQKPLFDLSKRYLKSPLPFQRRIALIILLKFINDDTIDYILKVTNSLQSETNYYVNMANAWLVCECFTKQKDKTFVMLEKHHLNSFTINKAISKCRDSFRVSREDKAKLLQFKIK